jgi:hypothetical protein
MVLANLSEGCLFRNIDNKNLISDVKFFGRALYRLYDACQGWFVLSIVGIASGAVATMVDIGSDWANDVKFGYCNRGWWISR